ncbi:MAG: DEAD/DEAH box helicase [Bdellovibrionales bacterium]|nr:DEAD/DEAH box helicase [Bdellovibrionales bacterium]
MAGIKAASFDECTPVQAAVIEPVLSGKDVSGLAQTGTGKTAAFLLPLMDRVVTSKKINGSGEVNKRAFVDWRKGQFVLILVPTRELAEQVYNDVYKLRGNSDLEAVAVYGGTSYDDQKQKFEKGVEFVVSTPGRLIDLYKSHVVDLKQVRAVVFDEADRMFDMGFKDDMVYLLNRIPKDRQMLLFSATLNFDVLTTAYKFGADPVEFNLSKDEVKAENVKDKILHAGVTEKPQHLLSLLKKENAKQVIIFTNFKGQVFRIANFLNDNGYHAVGISSMLTQNQRNRVLEQFKGESETNIMVATDLAARGLDIKGVDLVINYELPDDSENYIHRIGRTGRAGKTGTAYSLVGEKDVEALMRLEDYLKFKVDVLWLEDGEFVTEFKPMKEEERRTQSRSGQRGGDRPRRGGRNDRNDRNKRGDRNERRSGGGGQGSKSQSRDGGSRDGGSRSDQRRPEGESGSMHRDRKSGRHKQQDGQKGQEKRSPNSKRRNQRNRRRKNYRNQKQNQQPKTVGQKIKSLFKKLFS